MLEDVVALVYLYGDELTPYKQDVRQAFGFVDVAQCPSRFRGLFVSFDMRQLLVHQAHDNDGEGLLASSLVCLFDFVTRGGRWCQLRAFHDLPKIFGGQGHFQFEFIEIEVLATKVVNRYMSIIFARYHF